MNEGGDYIDFYFFRFSYNFFLVLDQEIRQLSE